MENFGLEIMDTLTFSSLMRGIIFSDLWEQVLKRKHALDKGDAIMPVHGNELRQCTSPLEVNCVIL